MWSLPISPTAAYIFLINLLRRVNESVDSWTACWVAGAVTGESREYMYAARGAARRRGAAGAGRRVPAGIAGRDGH